MINCKNCGAALKQDVFTCNYCGSDYKTSSNPARIFDNDNDTTIEESGYEEEYVEEEYDQFDAATIRIQNRQPTFFELYKSNFKYGFIAWCVWGCIRGLLPAFLGSDYEVNSDYKDVLFYSHVGTPLYIVGALVIIFGFPILISLINYIFYGDILTATTRFFKKALLASFLLWVALYFCRLFMPDGKTNLSEHNSLLFSPIGGPFWWVRCFLFSLVFPGISTFIFYKKKFK